MNYFFIIRHLSNESFCAARFLKPISGWYLSGTEDKWGCKEFYCESHRSNTHKTPCAFHCMVVQSTRTSDKNMEHVITIRVCKHHPYNIFLFCNILLVLLGEKATNGRYWVLVVFSPERWRHVKETRNARTRVWKAFVIPGCARLCSSRAKIQHQLCVKTDMYCCKLSEIMETSQRNLRGQN